MLDLADFAPLHDTLTIRGKLVPVHPLSLAAIGRLIAKHRELATAFVEGGDLVSAILDAGDDVVRRVVDEATQVLGLGACLTASEQGRVVFASLDMTIPSDQEEMADFLARLTRLMERVAKAAPESAAG